jgi:hypothetical protein
MKMDNRRHGIKLFALFLSLSAVFLLGHGCGGGSGGSDSGTTPPPTTSVVITGTVPGTVAIAYDYATGMEAARNVAGGTPKMFSLSVAPGEYYLMFIENEGTPSQRSFSFRNVTGGNVFTFKANTTLDLGVLVFDQLNGTAKPQIDPISGNGNVTEFSAPEASFYPGPGEWTVTRKFVNSTCPGHSPGATVTGNVKIAQGFGIVTFTPAGTTETAIGVANVNTAILTGYSGSALETIYLTRQTDGSLAGSFSKAGYGGGCSEEGTITAVLGTSPPPAATLTGLSINGPSSMSEYGTATYTATASWSDNSTSTITPTWGVNSPMASISPSGVLSCQTINTDQMATVTATYSAGGITKMATMNVTITRTYTNRTPYPLTAQMLSGRIFFEEQNNAEGDYSSSLFIFNADFSFQQYRYKNPPGMSEYLTGTWSIGGSGEVILNYADVETITVVAFDDLVYGTMILVDVGTGNPYTVEWEPTGPGLYPFRAVLQGTYVDQYGDTWTYNSNGTGSTTGAGGYTFTWSVDAGILKVVFSNGYKGWIYERSSSRYTMSPTLHKWAFVEYTPTGDFYFYYGGMELTPQ